MPLYNYLSYVVSGVIFSTLIRIVKLTVENCKMMHDDGSTMNERDEPQYHSSDNTPTFPSNNKALGYQVMILDVGGRKFQTTPDTLRAESGLFRHQLSDRFTWTAQADGSYFLDADPELFAHLLRFMRRPEVFPLFYSKTNGFNYDLYNRLEIEAGYFQITPLHDWIKNKTYLQAVVVHTYPARVCNLEAVLPETRSVNETDEVHYVPRTRRVYLCPRQIPVHRGDPQKCGAACRRAQGHEGNQFEEEQHLVAICVNKEMEHKAGLCRLDMNP